MLFLDLETSCTSQELANVLGIVGRLLSLLSIIVPILLAIFCILKLMRRLEENW